MNEPKWVSVRAVLAIQAHQIATFGGLPGLREETYLLSALARPQNLFAYDPEASIPRLAAAYAFGLSSNHPFNDGNKRISFLTMYVFLRRYAWEFSASESDVVKTFLDLAAGALPESDLADWVESHASPSEKP